MKQLFEQNKNKLNADIVTLNAFAQENILVGGYVTVQIDKYTGSCVVYNMKQN